MSYYDHHLPLFNSCRNGSTKRLTSVQGDTVAKWEGWESKLEGHLWISSAQLQPASTTCNHDSTADGSRVRNWREMDPRRAACDVVGYLLLEVFKVKGALLRMMWVILC